MTLPLATIFYPFTNDLSALPGVNNNSNYQVIATLMIGKGW